MKAMSRTRPWERKSAKLGGTGVALSPSVSRCSSSSPSPSTSPTVLAYAGSAPVSGLLRPATFRYRGLGVEEDQEQRRRRQQQENSEEEDQEEETEEEEQEAEEDNDSTARTLADEERYTEDREDENDGVADPHRSYAEEAHNYETALQLCQDGGSQGESNRREGEEEAGAEPGEEEAGAEPGRGTWEIWQEEDAGRAAGGVHDPGRDRGHGAVGETRDADVADDYDEDYEEEDEEDDDEDYEEDGKDYEDKDYEEEAEEAEEEEDDDDDDDLEPRGRGPTEEALAAARDEASAFMAYFPPEIEDWVIAMTNLEADRRRPAIDGWKRMGRVEFRAYVGLLVLAGVYRSRGEACESLWDAESGRSVFRAAMPLKTFRAYSSALRFDDREARRAVRGEGGGGGYDKLAPIRAVWDEWCARLPAMYRPGPEVTVDERLVPFRGRCPFRQYMPSKPARYGIKIWVACDARSSYAWKMQIYTGKPDKRGPPEKHLAARVVLDLTEGLTPGRNYSPAPRHEEREGGGGGGGGGGRGPDTIILSYVAKKNKNVLLLTTAHRYHRRSGPEPRPSRRRIGNGKSSSSSNGGGKPPLVLHYNRTKGGVDNLDKVVSTYSCRRKTCRWPVALFHNMVDVAAYNAFVLWRKIHPDWMVGKLNRQRLFLERLGKALARPMIEARALARGGGGGRVAARGTTAATTATTTATEADDADATPRDSSPVKRRRCRVCPRSKDVKTKILCRECRAHVCINCAVKYCPNCAASRNAASQTPPTS
ncbi:hypothetical protein ACER0C_003016 [Sarotherodon galilaeus]